MSDNPRKAVTSDDWQLVVCAFRRDPAITDKQFIDALEKCVDAAKAEVWADADFASEAMSVLRAWVRHQDSVDAAIIGGGGEPMPSPYREVLERARGLLRGAEGGER